MTRSHDHTGGMYGKRIRKSSMMSKKNNSPAAAAAVAAADKEMSEWVRIGNFDFV